MGHRMPLMCTSFSSAVSTGAWHRERFTSPVSTCRRSTNQTSGPGNVSRTATTRMAANAATIGPWLPSLMVWRVHASAGSAPATSSTVRAFGAPSTKRSRGGRRPRPRRGGLWVAGRSGQTRVVGGPSVKYHRPSPATPSRKPGLPPNASSATTQRHRSVWLLTTAASISWANAGLVLKRRSGGRPHCWHIQPTIQHGVALETDIAHQHAGLAVGPLAQFPAVLTLHTNGMAALLREITPINHQHAIVGTQVRFHCFPVLVQQPLIVPLPFAAKGLHGPYRLGSDTIHRQHHRLDRLAWQRRQQPLERGVRGFPLFPPLQQRAVDGVIGAQLLHQVLNIVDRQVHLGRGLDQVHHTALLPCRIDGQHYTTFRNLVVVLRGRNSHVRLNLCRSYWARLRQCASKLSCLSCLYPLSRYNRAQNWGGEGRLSILQKRRAMNYTISVTMIEDTYFML